VERCKKCVDMCCLQVAKAAFDVSARKWVLEGAVRSPATRIADIKQQPPVNPWNLGVFDALVLADKMTGCPGVCRGVRHPNTRGWGGGAHVWGARCGQGGGQGRACRGWGCLMHCCWQTR
jgi:hypothetical protein